MKKFLIFIAIIIIVGLLGVLINAVKQPAGGVDIPASSSLGLQSCPDEKINNRMPGPGGAKPSYYIVNGERREIEAYDAAWVAANCTVPEQTVY